MRIMIVDDDADDCELLLCLLQKIDTGLECAVIESAEAALTWLQAGNLPDVVFLDGRLPGIGSELLLTLLVEARLSTRIIMYSGFSGSEIKDRFIDLGANHFIEKSSDLNDVRRQIEEIMFTHHDDSVK